MGCIFIRTYVHTLSGSINIEASTEDNPPPSTDKGASQEVPKMSRPLRIIRLPEQGGFSIDFLWIFIDFNGFS